MLTPAWKDRGMTRDIKNLIETVIRNEFEGDAIEAVRVVEALDYQEDRVFKITVVFNKRGGLDPKKTSAIARHIRDKLDEAFERASPFPMVSFVSKADDASSGPEAA
jgi:hypothetical protein